MLSTQPINATYQRNLSTLYRHSITIPIIPCQPTSPQAGGCDIVASVPLNMIATTPATATAAVVAVVVTQQDPMVLYRRTALLCRCPRLR